MSKNPILNALVGLLYIALIVTIINFIPNSFEHVNTVLAPIAFLSLFVFSAASMGYIFLSQPIQLFLDGEKKESVDLFIKTLAAFAISAAILVLAGLYVTAHAHQENTTISDQVVGEYVVEFEHQQKDPVVAGSVFDYNFYLLDKDTKEIVSTDSMFVRFEDSAGELIMGASLQSSASFNGRVTGVMPKAGNYQIAVEFYRGGNKIVETTAPLTVVAPDAAQRQEITQTFTGENRWYWWVAVFGVGAVVGFILRRSVIH